MTGMLSDLSLFQLVLGYFAGSLVLGFLAAPLVVWSLAIAAFLAGIQAPMWAWAAFAVTSLVFNLLPLRRTLVTSPLMKWMKKSGMIPEISTTEREALEAGTVWAEGELFSGKPDWSRLMQETMP